MAKRTVDTELWNDEDIIENFTAEDRYFWLYLLTNPHNNICGVVKNSPALMARDMGLHKDTIINLLFRFEKVHGLIFTDKETNEIVILNWGKYNWTKSADLMKTVKKQLQSVQSEHIKAILNEKISEKLNGDGLGTVIPPSWDGTIPITITDTITDSIDNSLLTNNEQKNIKKDKQKESCKTEICEIVDYLNEVLGTNYKTSTAKTQSAISARLKEGFTVDDFKRVISSKVAEWRSNERMAKYLRPETLFGTKFESYLNACAFGSKTNASSNPLNSGEYTINSDGSINIGGGYKLV